MEGRNITAHTAQGTILGVLRCLSWKKRSDSDTCASTAAIS
ncbi:MAG: hypothetical protein ACLVJ6_09040 [Merdibacter sp.]